jgi:hypothetical protein
MDLLRPDGHAQYEHDALEHDTSDGRSFAAAPMVGMGHSLHLRFAACSVPDQERLAGYQPVSAIASSMAFASMQMQSSCRIGESMV